MADTSAFANRLGTNYAPSPSEAEQIKHTINTMSSEIAALEMEMARIMDLYEPLKRKRDMLLEQTCSHRRLLFLERQLPVEILREIFLFSLPNNPDSWMMQYECPLLLTRVCSRWRQVALSTTQLWSTIHVVVPEDSPSPSKKFLCAAQRQATAIKTWLSWAGASPLNITFEDCKNQATEAFFTNSASFVSIIEASPFWKEFSIVLGTHSTHFIADLKATELPLLERLNISQPHRSTFSLSHSGIWRAPNLRRLSIDVNDGFTSLNCKWSGLTHLTIRNPSQLSFTTLLNILGQCLRLRSFHLEAIKLLEQLEGEVNTIACREITLSDLQDVTFKLGLFDINPFLASLRLPSLESLSFHSEWELTPITQFLPSLSQSVKTIQSISTRHSLFPHDHFLDYLKQCSKLRYLRLFDHRKAMNSWPQPLEPSVAPAHTMTDVLLDVLSPVGHDHAYCPFPHLEHLEVLDDVDISEERLIEFIMQRQSLHQTQGIAKLEVVRIVNSCPRKGTV